jgi:SAM-dependent methyltransferase
VVGGNPDEAFARHLRICRLLKQEVKTDGAENGLVACEIGCGDCLSTADLFLGAGFKKVYLVEKAPIVLDVRQKNLLQRLSDLNELPNDMGSTMGSEELIINQESVSLVKEYFENALLPEKVDFLFSHDVVEHVEDLKGFFTKCAEVLAPRCVMVHKFDLSGHEFFEDPIPPLDFQTYPNWLYDLMFPKYRRSCRWFLDQIVREVVGAGFIVDEIRVLKSADRDYVERLRQDLRLEARNRTTDELTPLDVVIRAIRI